MKIQLIKIDWKRYRQLFSSGRMASILLGSAVLSFGIYNIHRRAGITEGGVLGLILLLDHWLGIPPAVASPALDLLCYAFSFRLLGKDFIGVSAVSTVCLAGSFFLWEQFPPVLPDLSGYPLAAALAGGAFVGVGAGLVVRQGGSTGGDDALALAISKSAGCSLFLAYFATDFTVLMLSLTYIPVRRIALSVLTVLVSSFLIDRIKSVPLRRREASGPGSEKTG